MSNFILIFIFLSFDAYANCEAISPSNESVQELLSEVDSQYYTDVSGAKGKGKKKFETVADFVCSLPSKMRENFIFVADSKSAQKGANASVENPRIILTSPENDIRVTIATDPTSQKLNDIEIAYWNVKEQRFVYEEVSFEKGKSHHDKNPASCKNCHGSPEKPNWDNYNFWAGVVPFNKDTLLKGSQEADWYMNYMDRIEQAKIKNAMLPGSKRGKKDVWGCLNFSSLDMMADYDNVSDVNKAILKEQKKTLEIQAEIDREKSRPLLKRSRYFLRRKRKERKGLKKQIKELEKIRKNLLSRKKKKKKKKNPKYTSFAKDSKKFPANIRKKLESAGQYTVGTTAEDGYINDGAGSGAVSVQLFDKLVAFRGCEVNKQLKDNPDFDQLKFLYAGMARSCNMTKFIPTDWLPIWETFFSKPPKNDGNPKAKSKNESKNFFPALKTSTTAFKEKTTIQPESDITQGKRKNKITPPNPYKDILRQVKVDTEYRQARQVARKLSRQYNFLKSQIGKKKAEAEMRKNIEALSLNSKYGTFTDVDFENIDSLMKLGATITLGESPDRVSGMRFALEPFGIDVSKWSNSIEASSYSFSDITSTFTVKAFKGLEMYDSGGSCEELAEKSKKALLSKPSLKAKVVRLCDEIIAGKGDAEIEDLSDNIASINEKEVEKLLAKCISCHRVGNTKFAPEIPFSNMKELKRRISSENSRNAENIGDKIWNRIQLPHTSAEFMPRGKDPYTDTEKKMIYDFLKSVNPDHPLSQ